MLRFEMLSLICAVSSGVFGFGGGVSSSWFWGQILFLVFLVFSVVAFLVGLMSKPRRWQGALIYVVNDSAREHS